MKKKPLDSGRGRNIDRRSAIEAELGRRLLGARQAAGLSQRQLSERLGVSVGHVSMAERAQRVPRLFILVAWAAVCGTSLSRLVRGLEESQTRTGGVP